VDQPWLRLCNTYTIYHYRFHKHIPLHVNLVQRCSFLKKGTEQYVSLSNASLMSIQYFCSPGVLVYSTGTTVLFRVRSAVLNVEPQFKRESFSCFAFFRAYSIFEAGLFVIVDEDLEAIHSVCGHM
jgi:hypothetical protein